MTDRIALTSNESSTPTLFIDTRAPLDELHASVILLRDGCDLLDVLGRRIRGSQYLS